MLRLDAPDVTPSRPHSSKSRRRFKSLSIYCEILLLKTGEGKTGAIELGNYLKGADFSKSARVNIFDVIIYAIFADGGYLHTYFATAQA
jgi:hypothetical protein